MNILGIHADSFWWFILYSVAATALTAIVDLIALFCFGGAGNCSGKILKVVLAAAAAVAVLVISFLCPSWLDTKMAHVDIPIWYEIAIAIITPIDKGIKFGRFL